VPLNFELNLLKLSTNQMPICPHVTTVSRNKNRDVSDDFDSSRVGVAVDFGPLVPKEELTCLDLTIRELP
jgi:hypothetical protein